jgi:hypothetical protein
VGKTRPGSSPGFGTKISITGMGKRGKNPVPRFYLGFSGPASMPVWRRGNAKKKENMNEGLLLLIVIVGWFVLNRFILPRLGVRT